MRNRHRAHERDTWDSFGPVEWPDADLDVDDEEFARAIEEGRAAEAA
jgi:hypothetical protein